MNIDVSSVEAPKVANKKLSRSNWAILVDRRTNFKISSFHDRKSDMVEPMLEQFQKSMNSGKTVSKIRCDNAGENKTLQERCGSADWKFPAKFEFAARATPQQNACAENAFAALCNKGRALMIAANVPVEC